MTSLRARAKPTVQKLLETVKQLSPAELREFEQQFAAWRALDGNPDLHSLNRADEEGLLACILENSSLPTSDQSRFNRLRHKRQAGKLTGTEEKELQALWERVEKMNVTRLEAVAELSRRRGTDVKTLMRDLGLSENHDVF